MQQSKSSRSSSQSGEGSATTSLSPILHCDPLPYSSIDTTDHFQRLIPSYTLSPKAVENSLSYQKSLLVCPVQQPLDHSRDLGSAHPYNSTNHARSTDTISSSSASTEVQYSQKMFPAVLDLVDAKPRSRTRSMPYLPREDEIRYTQARSARSVDASEGNFPLSLFPTPPAFIARKRIPPPLVLRNSPPTSSQSSRDSTPLETPVETPATPRLLSPRSPSQSNFCKRLHLGRRVTSISPPPSSPPNSPLPSPPVHYEDNGRPLASRPLRTSYSISNPKDALPFSATHRLTFSEPISDQSSLPIKILRKPRPEGMKKECPQTCLVSLCTCLNVTSICSPSRIRRREAKYPQLPSKTMYNGATRFRTWTPYHSLVSNFIFTI